MGRFCSYGNLIVVTGYFYGIIHSRNGVISIPVVPHRAVAEVSKIGNL